MRELGPQAHTHTSSSWLDLQTSKSSVAQQCLASWNVEQAISSDHTARGSTSKALPCRASIATYSINTGKIAPDGVNPLFTAIVDTRRG